MEDPRAARARLSKKNEMMLVGMDRGGPQEDPMPGDDAEMADGHMHETDNSAQEPDQQTDQTDQQTDQTDQQTGLALWGELAQMNPVAAMAVVLQVPVDSPRLAGGVAFYQLQDLNQFVETFAANMEEEKNDSSGGSVEDTGESISIGGSVEDMGEDISIGLDIQGQPMDVVEAQFESGFFQGTPQSVELHPGAPGLGFQTAIQQQGLEFAEALDIEHKISAKQTPDVHPTSLGFGLAAHQLGSAAHAEDTKGELHQLSLVANPTADSRDGRSDEQVL